MKRISLLLILFLIVSCSSPRNYQQFYNTHKNDANTTSFQMPQFLTNVLRGMSPEMNSLFRNIDRLRILSINEINPASMAMLNTEINLLTERRFTDILRKNEEKSRLIITAIEYEGLVKELVYFNRTDNHVLSFQLKGIFDSNDIKELSKKGEFDKFASDLIQYNTQIAPISIQ